MDGNYSLSDIAAVTEGNRGGMFGGNGDWGAWIILFLLFGLFGRGGWGGGFGGGGNECFSPCATQADVRAAVDQQTLISKLDQQTYGLADSTYALNNAITGGFHGVERQLADCCCTTQRAIDGVNFNMAKGFCDLGNVMNTNTRDILENQNTNTRAILDFLTNDKIATLTAENQALKFKASQSEQNAFITANQEAQTATLLRRLGADCPTPAYVVQPPTPVHFPYNNCGCGCGNTGYGFAG
jgi:ferredoxin-like protein FixX